MKPLAAIGFLTVLDDDHHGLFGGYLLLNVAGRPLQFHCTAPIKPNRAQQILYGPTLESFLYGEQIGQTLVEKATAEASLICTDREPVLAVRQHILLPVALVLPADSQPSDHSAQPAHICHDHPALGVLNTFQVGHNRLAVPEQSADDRAKIVEQLVHLPQSFDLAEPFTRIRAAIEEARQAGSATSRRAA